MKVKNQQCIRRLSYRSLWASRKRNLIAIIAIALTTLLFTSLFTIVMSINSSYQTYQFRQLGGYNHGTFKSVNEEQLAAISAHPNVKEAGARTVIGFLTTDSFAKVPAEISYMDANTTKWCYALPTTGHMPEKDNEIAMDTEALRLLGITPELGAEIQLSYALNDKEQTGPEITDTFILSGYWEYDDLMPVHFINISESYLKEIMDVAVTAGMAPFRTDLNVMMKSAIDIQGQMEQVDTDLGYTWDSFVDENSVRIGVNWGYTSSQLDEKLDPEMVLSIIAFIILVVFTGYLIIYNIFQISVTGDIRFYGLLKTIGVTPTQLRRIIRQQALLLCLIGIPIGLLLGYITGAILTPAVIKSSTSLGETSSTVSISPLIFVGSTLFSLLTVLLSCKKPGRIAAKVSPIEATKYTENTQTRKKQRHTRGANVSNMAFANLGRNRSKTILVFVSLALSVILLNILYTFVGGFDMELYLSNQTCADFIVSSTDYFRFNQSSEFITEDAIGQIESNTEQSLAGCGYVLSDNKRPLCWVSEETYRALYANWRTEEEMEQLLSLSVEVNDDNKVSTGAQLLGLDPALFEKLTVLEGDLDSLFSEDSHAIALSVYTDDYGNVRNREMYPEIGDTLRLTYVSEGYYIDSRTGEPCTENTPEEYIDYHITKSIDIDYTVCALVSVPYSMSYRYTTIGSLGAILPAETITRDSGMSVVPLYYLFDTPTEAAEQNAEAYLAELTANDLPELMYNSKETLRTDFKQFQNLFILLGGLLCTIIGFVGILNFFNAIMTGILSRRREFAVLQAVGMTNSQLKSMLIYEGLLYSLGSVLIALILSAVMNPFIGKMLENMFWFFRPHFTILPVVIVIPVFLLFGWLIPTILYGQTAKHSVVERLRETE